MEYSETNLNKWDYVFAITQEQINYGLRDLYKAEKLPTNFSASTTLFFQECNVRGTFGMPVVEAIEYGLKLCKITLPLIDAELTIGEHKIPIPSGASVSVKTSLTSIELDVKTEDGQMRGVYVDFKDENAIYDFKVNGLKDDQVAVIESIVRKKLTSLNGNTYLITAFKLTDEAFKYVPKLVRFTFNYNSDSPELSPFIVCSSVSDKEPDVENPLVFDSKILPDGLPACVWLSQQFLVGRVLTPSMNNTLGTGKDFKYDGESGISLVNTIKNIDPDGDREVNLVDFDLTVSEHAFQIYNKVKIPNITFLNITGIGEGWSKVNIGLTEDQTTLQTSSEVLETKSDTEDVPWWATAIGAVFGIIGAAITAIVIAIINAIVDGKVDDEHKDGLENALKDAIKGINETTAQIPALQDSLVNGHVVFDGATLENNGSLGLGISNTEAKKALMLRREKQLQSVNLESLEASGIGLSEEAQELFKKINI